MALSSACLIQRNSLGEEEGRRSCTMGDDWLLWAGATPGVRRPCSEERGESVSQTHSLCLRELVGGRASKEAAVARRDRAVACTFLVACTRHGPGYCRSSSARDPLPASRAASTL